MKNTQRLTQVTPEELQDILDRLDPEQTTHLGIIGDFAEDPWGIDSARPEYFRNQPIYQLSNPWSWGLHRIVRFRRLNHLILEGLNIDDTGARAIAKHLPQLTSLDVGSNEITKVGIRAITKNLPQLTSLSITNNLIGDEGASAISELKELTSLSLGLNQISKSGARKIAECLTKLTSLSIDRNEIGETGAASIAEHLKTLTYLNVGGNQIGDKVASLIAERLTKLTSLLVWGNEISDKAACDLVENLRLLKHLFLNSNQIGLETISAIAKRLENLTHLTVANNKNVRNIEELAALPRLQHLNVSGTSVSDLSPFADKITSGWPVQWNKHDQEDGLIVADCPLTLPTVEVASQGPSAVQNYFRELAAQGEDYLYEAKVLILGEGGSGKTSLLRRLYQPDKELPNEDETTRGIDIHRQEFVGNHGQPFRLNVWDFGGQQIYHATHQFFLTKNSLYVLVDDTRKDDKTIHDEWL